MKLPVVAGKDVILVVCNRLSKTAHFVAMTKEYRQRDWQDYSRITYEVT